MSNPTEDQNAVDKINVSLTELRHMRKGELKEMASQLMLEISNTMKKCDIIALIANHLGLPDVQSGGETMSESHVVNGEVEMAKIELERERLNFQREEKEREREREEREKEREEREKEREFELRMLELKQGLSEDQGSFRQRGDNNSPNFDITKHIRLVPKFDEGDVESFFIAFEKIANRLKWPKEFWTLLLQSGLTGKAQEVFACSSDAVTDDYFKIKESILSAYELVPEAYRQKFRKLKRVPDQSFVEFAREKEMIFDRWYRSLHQENNFDNLREVLLLEEFKRSIPSEIKLHLDERKVMGAKEAAIMADDYELTHKISGRFHLYSKDRTHNDKRSNGTSKPFQNKGFTGDKKFTTGGPTCHYCKKRGHIKSECYKWKNDQQRSDKKPVAFAKSSTHCRTEKIVKGVGEYDVKRPKLIDNELQGFEGFVFTGVVSPCLSKSEGKSVTILRDTGATQSLVLADAIALPQCSSENASALIQGIDGSYLTVPLYKIHLKCGLVTGPVTVGVVKTLPIKGVSFVLGNDLAGERVSVPPVILNAPVVEPLTENLEEEYPGIFPACVVTRSQAHMDSKVLDARDNVCLADTFFANLDAPSLSEAVPQDGVIDRTTLIKGQQEDPDLLNLRNTALSIDEARDIPECYYMKDDILMRKWRPPQRPADEEWSVVHQIIVPPGYRKKILRLAHEIPMAGHLGIRKTQARISNHFYWPKLHKDVVHFCKTCHVCQIIGKPQPSIKPAPLIPIPVFEEPFSRVIVDCVGPLPRTKSGYNYLLTIMDLSSRFPEAIPLRKIGSKFVVEALLQFFTRYGLPKEIQSDQGSNFMSGLFQEVMSELGIHQIKSSAYHPQSQGALERDVPNESTGFSPFELVYGHDVRGPLKLIKERFLNHDDETNLLDYVSTFRERLSQACEVARNHLKDSQQSMKERADKNAVVRTFNAGDKVLVLLPIFGEPLEAKFSGPYVIKKKLNDVNYVVSTPDRRKSQRVCHVSMLKPYLDRQPMVCVSRVVESVDESVEPLKENELNDSHMDAVTARLSNSEILENIDNYLAYLAPTHKHDISALLTKYHKICTDKLGCTTVATHDVDVGDSNPIRQHPYRLSRDKLLLIRQE
ncbi:uncharacterized protein LOC117103773, partial [Anneissia japonica]|uniref:uncharacterized protein LOC117103773 n=1 Tax=Anneissia japonica TaxID=1529436 RepID=UPI001425A91F